MGLLYKCSSRASWSVIRDSRRTLLCADVGVVFRAPRLTNGRMANPKTINSPGCWIDSPKNRYILYIIESNVCAIYNSRLVDGNPTRSHFRVYSGQVEWEIGRMSVCLTINQPLWLVGNIDNDVARVKPRKSETISGA